MYDECNLVTTNVCDSERDHLGRSQVLLRSEYAAVYYGVGCRLRGVGMQSVHKVSPGVLYKDR